MQTPLSFIFLQTQKKRGNINMNRARLEKLEAKIEEQIDILTNKDLTKQEKLDQIPISQAIFKGVQVVVSAEAVVEKYRATKNDIRETNRLIKKFGTEMGEEE
jgi:hypothetical protein